MGAELSDERPTHLDLFSGIGGFSLAFEAEGFRTIGFSEIDPYACAVLKKHWPNVTNYGDVRNVPAVGCDVLTGGFPCQPFSVAGQRRGKADDRYLWPAMLATVRTCKPSFILAENVPGIAGMELARLLSDLETAGFCTVAFSVPACAVGAEHRRERIWIVANGSGQPLQESEVVPSTRQIPESGNAGFGLPGNLWRFNRETYLDEMAGNVHGVPCWMDRAKALGNSIVPQVAQIFARAIYQQIIQ